MVGRDLSQTLYGQRKTSVRPQGRARAVGAEPAHGGDGEEQLALGVCRPDHRRVRPGRVGPHRDLQGRGRRRSSATSSMAARCCSTAGRCATACPRAAVRDGIVYVTEDRKLEGFFETMSIAENIYLGLLAKLRGAAHAGVAGARPRGRRATGSSGSTSARSARTSKAIELSGGNQQKVVIAKSLVQEPEADHLRRADARRRRRRDRRDPPADQPACRRGQGGGRDLVLPARGDVAVRPHPGAAQGKVVEEFSALDATEEKIMYAAIH